MQDLERKISIFHLKMHVHFLSDFQAPEVQKIYPSLSDLEFHISYSILIVPCSVVDPEIFGQVGVVSGYGKIVPDPTSDLTF
jgi:hypothetical protein